MIWNYFKIAWRNLEKNKTFSLINIAGLSLGMTTCILILQYVSFELSYDQFNSNAQDLYRVYNDRYQNGKLTQHGTITYSAIGKAMQDEYPEIINHARVVPLRSVIIRSGEKKIEDNLTVAADNSFLEMFTYPLVAGNKTNALSEPNSIVISEKIAGKLFDYTSGNYQDLIGKTIVFNRDSIPQKITGVCKNVPENSHLQFDILLSYVSLYSGGNNNWKQAEYDFTNSDFWHYLQLQPGTDYKALEAKFPAFSDKYFQGNKVSGSEEKFYLQPLSKAHLYSDFEYEIGKTGNAGSVWALLIIGLFIIVIAWVNYINLATAKSAERAKEVGIRKVSGAGRFQLIRQFLLESILINCIALMVAVVLVLALQNSFNQLLGYNLSMSYLFHKGLSGYTIAIGLISIFLIGIIVSGFYPAFVLSSFKPILVLKGKFSASNKGILLRKGLVIGQFAITVALIIGSIIVYQQMTYVGKQKLGMNLDQILLVKPPVLTQWDSTFIGRQASFKEELKQLPHISNVAMTDRPIGQEMARAFTVHPVGANPDVNYAMRNYGASQEFLDVYDIKLANGRNFSANDYNYKWSNLHNILLNESAVRLMGYQSNEEALGKQLEVFNKTWDIIGIIEDFHQKSLHYPVEPMFILPTSGTNSPISIKIDPVNVSTTIASIKDIYEKFFPGNLFDYGFIDEKFNEQYKNDVLFGKVFALFSGFAIFIACLGLLGLSLFTTTQRIKEIGVRKVLGASVSNIVMLLSKDFIVLIIIAFVIATPLAWYFMNNWLENFAYRININWWVFFFAGLIAILIAVATISSHAIKTALANPVKSLRTE